MSRPWAPDESNRAGVWGGVLPTLLEMGHDVTWSGSWEQDPGDAVILQHAHTTRKILVTLDKDFGELAVLKGMPHYGIIRLTGFRAKQMAAAIHHIVTNYEQDLTNSAIITADPEGIRVRIP